MNAQVLTHASRQNVLQRAGHRLEIESAARLGLLRRVSDVQIDQAVDQSCRRLVLE